MQKKQGKFDGPLLTAEIGAFLRYLREQKLNKSLKETGALYGINESQVSRIENADGFNPRFETRKNILATHDFDDWEQLAKAAQAHHLGSLPNTESDERAAVLSDPDAACSRLCREITDLVGSAGYQAPRAKEAAAHVLARCAASLRAGKIHLAGKEMGYFKHLLGCIERSPRPEKIKAYIRLSAFAPEDLTRLSWFETFYKRLREAVQSGKLEIDYIFLIRGRQPTGATQEFIDRYKAFANTISTLNQETDWIDADLRRPSLVLLETQRIAFTHDRTDDASLLEAIEWLLPADYDTLHARFDTIQLASSKYWSKD